MECNWDKKLIFNLYRNPESHEDITGLLASYFGFLDNIRDLFLPLKEKLLNDSCFFYENNYLYELIDTMTSKNKITNISHPPYKESFTKHQIFELTNCFYGSLDKSFFDLFEQRYRERNSHFRFTNPFTSKIFAGSTFHSHKANETFIVSQYDGTFANIIEVIHEYAHAIAFNMIDKNTIEPDLFSEIESLFMEFIAFDFFEENYSEYAQDILNARLDKYYSIILDAKNVFNKMVINIVLNEGFANFDEQNNIKILRLLKKETGLSYLSLLKLINIPVHLIAPYPIGGLIAIELYEKYRNDPKTAFELYRQIISIDYKTNKEFYEKLQAMGIIPNANIETFEKRLIKH